jgi:hypothetical protein
LAADEASAQPLEAAMSRFSDAEISCVASQRLGRLAAVGADGLPHVVPVSFRYNPDADVDHRPSEEFRVVQMTPPGSACSTTHQDLGGADRSDAGQLQQPWRDPGDQRDRHPDTTV